MVKLTQPQQIVQVGFALAGLPFADGLSGKAQPGGQVFLGKAGGFAQLLQSLG